MILNQIAYKAELSGASINMMFDTEQAYLGGTHLIECFFLQLSYMHKEKNIT